MEQGSKALVSPPQSWGATCKDMPLWWIELFRTNARSLEMVQRLNSRGSALIVFGVSAVFIIFFYIILFFQADAHGQVGFYILPFSSNLTNLHIGCFLLLIASVIIFAQKGSRF